MELISVIIPVYNRVEIFEHALTSIINQTHRPLQIIVVDDGSHEDIKFSYEKICKEFESSDQTFLYIRQENRGAPSARNKGLEKAIGKYIIFWDADVIGELSMLQSMYEVLKKNPDISFVYSNFLFGKRMMRGMLFSPEELRKKNYITTMSLICKKDTITWDETLKRFQDWDLWLTMTEEGKRGVWIDKTLFRVETGGTMSSWLPSFAYKTPFKFLPFFYSKVRRYENAKKVICNKHGL